MSYREGEKEIMTKRERDRVLQITKKREQRGKWEIERGGEIKR
jgi:hypothetical protein